jgi:signal transduction histidine kinase
VEKANLTLTIDAHVSDVWTYVDRDMWEKVVLNLVSNAFKFTLAGGITVGLSKGHGQVRLAVQDTGSGIPPEELPRLFERFHRVEVPKVGPTRAPASVWRSCRNSSRFTEGRSVWKARWVEEVRLR